MAIQTATLERAFRYNSVDLIDPGPQYTADQVRDFYAPTYPEILNAAIEGPDEKDGKLVYTFRRAVGTKGSESSLADGFIKKYREMTMAKLVEHCQRDPDRICAFVIGKDWDDAEGVVLVVKGADLARTLTKMLADQRLLSTAHRVGPR